MTSYYESFTFYLLEYFFRQYLYLFYKFSKILISSQGNHDDHCLFSMIILLLLLLSATYLPNLKLLSVPSQLGMGL